MRTEETGHLKNFQGIYRESKQDPPVLWRSGNGEVLDKNLSECHLSTTNPTRTALGSTSWSSQRASVTDMAVICNCIRNVESQSE